MTRRFSLVTTALVVIGLAAGTGAAAAPMDAPASNLGAKTQTTADKSDRPTLSKEGPSAGYVYDVPGQRPVDSKVKTYGLDKVSNAPTGLDGLKSSSTDAFGNSTGENAGISSAGFSAADTKAMEVRTAEAPFDGLSLVGITWKSSKDEKDFSIAMRTRINGAWSDWEAVETIQADGPASHDRGAVQGSEGVVVQKGDRVQVALSAPAGSDVSTPEVSVISTEEAPADKAAPVEDGGSRSSEGSSPRTGEGVGPEGEGGTDGASFDSLPTTPEETQEGGFVNASAPAAPAQGVANMAASIMAATSSVFAAVPSQQAPAASSDILPRTPVIYSRAAWGAKESYRTWSPRYGAVRGAIVHHTAGGNNYSSSQVPQILRSTYYYHAVQLGWGDIGYNVLVDRYGRAWEGRYGGVQLPIVAGHARQFNNHTFGISVLGNFDSSAIPQAAFDTVARVTAWKLQLHGVKPDSRFRVTNDSQINPNTRYRTVSGHRDMMSTACPGRYFYSRMGELRTLTAKYQKAFEEGTLRYSGSNRYLTSVDTTWRSFLPNRQAAFIASGEEFPDGLAAGPAADRLNSPLLLTARTGLKKSAYEELKRINPRVIYVVGSSAAVSWGTEQELKRRHPNAQVVRISGHNRYATAAALAASFPSSTNEVFLASGGQYPDALSGGAAAAERNAPLLLSYKNNLSNPTRQQIKRIKPKRVYLIGDTSVLSTDVVRDVRRQLPNAEIVRVAGPNRYQTSAEVAKRFFPNANYAYYVNGTAFPDALSAGAGAAVDHAPILLIKRSCSPYSIRQYVWRAKPSYRVLMGDTSVLTHSSHRNHC